MTAAIAAEAGIVSTQAQTICPAMPHRTADRRRIGPPPLIAPVMVGVVPTGTPGGVAANSGTAPAVVAAAPLLALQMQRALASAKGRAVPL